MFERDVIVEIELPDSEASLARSINRVQSSRRNSIGTPQSSAARVATEGVIRRCSVLR